MPYSGVVTVVFVHGLPETQQIWDPLRPLLQQDSVALGLPGLGSPRPPGFTATKDAFARWLGEELVKIEPPVDVVAHDIGALITLRVASALDVPLRSWAVDVADIFHPRFVWPERVHKLQTPGVGEEMMLAASNPDDPESSALRLARNGVPDDLARVIGRAHDEVMSQTILDFYRSAVPNVAAGWWNDGIGPTRSRGLVLLLPDPPEHETMSLEVARDLGAETARLDGLNHCWMAEAPAIVAPVLERFWEAL